MSTSSAPNHHPSPCPPQNPNPNFYFHSIITRPPPLPPQISPPPPPSTPTSTTPILDLATALTSLTHLLSLTHQSLSSLPSFVSTQFAPPKFRNPNHVSCPYNPHHLMSPESLFPHSLHCPSPLPVQRHSFFDSLHYPKTLHLQNPPKTVFPQSIQNPNNIDLCLSLDGYYDEFSSNFFYKDCPGVVNINDLDNPNKTFTLPGLLSVECANVVGCSEGDIKGFDEKVFRVFPSDVWAIRREIDGWIDYPSMCSYSVFCAILGLNVIKRSDLRRWVIENSLRYAVVIDMYMRDHISVLFGLCLKAIRKEALGLVCCEMDKKSWKFECTVLVQVLMWIASQLSVLYGEVNAKCFAIHIFKQCALHSTSKVQLLPFDSNLKQSSGDLDANGSDIVDSKLEEPLEGSAECKVGKVNENVDEVIFVSQVAAAVAALHERSLLDAKIKALWASQPLPRYQRLVEHAYVSNRANEERKKRPDYRAIIDHDSLLRKQSSNQETNKTKTREELLAEERDYKRRRTSYRGKKLKRTTLEVTRDIIDEYMEEIKQAGGIGCFEKGAEEEGMSLKPSSAPKVAVEDGELRKSNSDFADAIKSTPDHYWIQSHSDHKEAIPQDYEQKGRTHHGHHEHLEYQKSAKRHICGREDYTGSHGRDYYSGHPERRRSHSRSHERRSHRRERDYMEITKSKDREMRSSSKDNYHVFKSSYSMPDSANNFSIQKDDKKLDVRDRNLIYSHGNHSSNYLPLNGFEDRYDPTESHETHEDVHAGSKYVRPEAFYD